MSEDNWLTDLTDPQTPEEKAHLGEFIKKYRDALDRTAAEFGVDDPLHPWKVIDTPWHNWREFTEQVCDKIVEASDSGDQEALQAALAKFRTVCPYYLATSLSMALRSLKRAEGRIEALESAPKVSLETMREQFLDAISNYSEDRWAAGWMSGIEKDIRSLGGVWDEMAKVCGWPIGYRAEGGWEPYV